MHCSLTWSFLFLLLACNAEAKDDHDDHDAHKKDEVDGEHDGHDEHNGHDEHSFEWAGIFETPAEAYTWIAQKKNGRYADASMKMAVLSATSATVEALSKLKSEGKESLEANCTIVRAGGTITAKADTCFKLEFDQDVYTSIFKVDARGVSALAFFTEHVPTEFEQDAHYLKTSTGGDVEPLGELPTGVKNDTEKSERPWGHAIGAAMLVNIVTLIGVILLVPSIQRVSTSYNIEFQSIVSAFAAGALLACAFFLLLFESTHLIAADWKEEQAVVWRWGTMILAGFALPAVLDTSIHAMAMAGCFRYFERRCNSRNLDQSQSGESDTKDVEKEATKEAKNSDADFIARVRLIGGILIGDFFHNLCDGFFMGAAFVGCGPTFGWTVVVGTVAHELAQEIADFAILTGDGALKPAVALALNFLSGTSVLLGVLIILSRDVSSGVIGMLLAFGGGVYIHVAATDCMPKVYAKSLSLFIRLACVGFFFLGAVAIGMVLLDHEHCDVADGDAHAGHGH